MFLISRVKKIIESFKKPVWLQWNWFPKEGEPPTQSIFEILIYLFVSIYCYCLFVDFNKIIRQTFIISADKLSYSRYLSRTINNDTTYYFHYQVGNINLQLPRTTIQKQDTFIVYSVDIFEDSIKIVDLNEISEKIDTLCKSGLDSYWRAVFDNFAEYYEYQPLPNLLKHNHLQYGSSELYNNFKGVTSYTNGHLFQRIQDRFNVPNPNKWIHRYHFSLMSSIDRGKITNEEKAWKDKIEQHHFSSEKESIINGDIPLYCIENFTATDNIKPTEHYRVKVFKTSNITNKVSIQQPGWFERHDISQGWFEIKLNSLSLDSIGLTINFGGATEFYPMQIEPDEKGSNYIKFTDPLKILHIRKEGLLFYAKFKELENRQIIRSFAVTSVLSGLLIVLLTFFILGIYRGLRTIQESIKKDRNIHL